VDTETRGVRACAMVPRPPATATADASAAGAASVLTRYARRAQVGKPGVDTELRSYDNAQDPRLAEYLREAMLAYAARRMP
jgi:hypothetical protein